MEIRPSYRLRKLFWFITAIGLLLMIAVSVLSGFLSYLQSEKFVKVVESSLSDLLQSQVSFQDLSFKTKGAQAQAMDVAASSGLTVRMDGLEMKYQLFEALKTRELQVPLIQVDRAVVSQIDPQHPASQSSKEVVEVQAPGQAFDPSLWMLLLPQSMNLEAVEVAALRFDMKSTVPSLRLDEMHWKFEVGDFPQSVGFTATHPQGARFEGLGLTWPLHLQRVRGRYQGGMLHFQEIFGRLGQQGQLRLSGQVDPNLTKPWSWVGEIRDLSTEELPDFVKPLQENFSGFVDADFKAQEDLVEGKVVLKEASSPSPLTLRLMGELLRTDRLRRLQWDRAEFSYQVLDRQRVLVKDLLLDSHGLVRIQGDLTVKDLQSEGPSPISGDLWLGVSKAALRWVPTLEKALFNETREEVSEYVWTKVKVSGTTTNPQEDFSPRLEQAMSQSAIELSTRASELLQDLVGTVLPTAKPADRDPQSPAKEEKKRDVPPTVPDAVIEQGSRLLDSVLPMLPLGP